MARLRRPNRMPTPGGNDKKRPTEGGWSDQDRCDAMQEAVKSITADLGMEGALCILAALSDAWQGIDVSWYVDDDSTFEEREEVNEAMTGIGSDIEQTAQNIENLFKDLEDDESDELIPE